MSVSLNTAAALQRPAPMTTDARDGANGRPAGSAGSPTAAPDPAGPDAAYTISTSTSTQGVADPSGVTGVQPDIDGDGARLMALSIQQAMSSSTGSIANASTQSILGLFKG